MGSNLTLLYLILIVNRKLWGQASKTSKIEFESLRAIRSDTIEF